MQEKFVIIENTLVRNLFARLHTANLSWPGMDTWAREMEGYTLFVRGQYPSLTGVYMGYREPEYTVLVFHVTNTIL